MNGVLTIALVFVAIVASLFCLSSSMCAVTRGPPGGNRMAYALLSLVSLAVAIGAVMFIGKLNRKS